MTAGTHPTCRDVEARSAPRVRSISFPITPSRPLPHEPTGRELTDNPLEQIAPFGATFHLGQEVSGLQRQADGRLLVETSKSTRLPSKTVFIAAGVGSLQPRALEVDGLEKFEGSQLFCRVRNAAQFADNNLVIVGGELRARLRGCEQIPHARSSRPKRPCSAANARRADGHGCALRLDWGTLGALLGHAGFIHTP